MIKDKNFEMCRPVRDFKMERYNWIVLTTWLCVSFSGLTVAAQCNGNLSSRGTEFMLGIPGPGSTPQEIFLQITTESVANVRVTAPSMNTDETSTFSNVSRIFLNGSHAQMKNGTEYKGVKVTSDVPVSVEVLVGNNDCTEGYMALPTNVLSTRYVAASYTPINGDYSQLMVVGLEENTSVTINVKNSGLIEKNLHRYESLLYRSVEDVSGAIVTSTKPVAVFSGCSYSQIPVNQGDFQYLLEQMIPTQLWGKKFIVTPIYPRRYYVIKVFAIENSTEVNVWNTSRHFTEYMNQGSVFELLCGTDPTVVLSNKAVSVVQYGYDFDGMFGDPFLTNVQGVDEYTDIYRVMTEPFHRYNITLAITVKSSDEDGLQINGISIDKYRTQNVLVTDPMQDFKVLFVNVSYGGIYKIEQTDHKTFGAIVYGLIFTTVAYGHPIEMRFNNKSNGRMCFSCKDYLHLKYCDKVERCQTVDQVCYVQGYKRNQDVTVYSAGCIKKTRCHSLKRGTSCLECCDGNFCNTHGCGDAGIQSVSPRGPICFECNHRSETEICSTVQTCAPNEVCQAEKYSWAGNEYYYIQRCASAQLCGISKRSLTNEREIHTQHVPSCSQCCSTDFCNMNCTSSAVPAIIG